MSNQSFLYNSDASNPNINPIFNVNKPTLIRAGGLEECVPIYMLVGDCPDCRPEDVIWEPMVYCGEPVEICPDNNTVLLSIPNKYSLGNPSDGDLALAGDVNITMQKGVDPSLVGKCEAPLADPLPVEIQSDCDNPVFVQLCPEGSIQVETAMAELGCIFDAEGVTIGKVMLCKVIDETTGLETVTQTAYYEDGTVSQNYTGVWGVCSPDLCIAETPIGVITDLTLLN